MCIRDRLHIDDELKPEQKTLLDSPTLSEEPNCYSDSQKTFSESVLELDSSSVSTRKRVNLSPSNHSRDPKITLENRYTDDLAEGDSWIN